MHDERRCDTETVRAIEAIVMVAARAGRARPAGPAARAADGRDRAAVRRAGRRLRRGGPRLRAGQGRRRLPVPDHADLAPYVERFLLDGQRARMSAAALETLAIVAYKQPISRAQVAAIRGVDPDGVMRTLQAARLHRPRSPATPGPGQAILYGTTPRSSRSSASTR